MELPDPPTRPAVVLDPPPTTLDSPAVHRPRRGPWKPWSYRCLSITILVVAVVGPLTGVILGKMFPLPHVQQAPCCATYKPLPPRTVTTTIPVPEPVAAVPAQPRTPAPAPPVVRHRAPETTTNPPVPPSPVVTTPKVPPSSAPKPPAPKPSVPPSQPQPS